MSGWFDLLAPADQERMREKFSTIGRKASVLDKARAGSLGGTKRWQGHKKKEKVLENHQPKQNT